MSEMSKVENVMVQYTDGKNLLIRQKLYNKHSTNKYGMQNWLFDQYQFVDNCRILELGCGTGAFWENRIHKLPINSFLLLSDFSENMIQDVWTKLSDHSNVLVQKIDIQNIPFPNNSFDFIIANHMLYHVPDLQKAIMEVHRVLKPDGIFYCTTNGTNGMSKYLHQSFKEFNPSIDAFDEGSYPFSLQNGQSILGKFFGEVKLVEYIDSLRVTETQDLIDWIQSTITISGVPKDSLIGLYDYFEKIRLEKGYIEIPKQVGIFISQK